MKTMAVSVAITLAVFSGSVLAAQTQKTMEQMTVSGSASFAGCAPAVDAHSEDCTDILTAIRRHFTPLQRGEIYYAVREPDGPLAPGIRTPLIDRYVRFLGHYEHHYLASRRHTVASAAVAH